MFVTSTQIYVFIASIAFGGFCGVLFSISELFKNFFNNVFLRIIPDLIAFIITAFLYILYASLLKFPNFRLYMPLGVILGIFIYLKSFHILLAKYVKITYNIFVKIFSRMKKTKDERGKN